MKLSVIIPCYNEFNTIDKVIESVYQSSYSNKEIIVVDDFSHDGPRDKLKNEIELSGKVKKIIYHERNQGKGASIRSGIQEATGDLIIIQDADFEYNPNEYHLLIDPILQNKADVVYGSRFARGAGIHQVLYFWHSLGNRLLTLISNMFSNLYLTDMETCYKIFRREILQSIIIEENRFGFEPEITAKLAKLKCRIFEVGISYQGRSYKQGKKISWKDGVRAIYCIVKYNCFR
jgi:glycosyltransferase involved in cell wall biosynthesis